MALCHERGLSLFFFFFQAEDGIRDLTVTGVQTCALPISLVLGKLDGAYILASETCALDLIHAEFVREIEPGEVLIINEHGLRSERPFRDEQPAFCMFEYVYFARPDSIIGGMNFGKVCPELGWRLPRRFCVG